MAFKSNRTKKIYPCPGSYRVSDARTWYTPPGKSTMYCTICEECFDKYLKNYPVAKDYGEHSDLKLCNCNFDKFFDKPSFEMDSFTVRIIDAKTGEPYVKINDQFTFATNISYANLPTSTEYIIHVDNLVGNYFTFESGSIDEKKIVVNEEQKTYYSEKLIIDRFGTGTNNPFLFIAQPGKEDVTNTIKLKFCIWKREEEKRQQEHRRFCDIRYSEPDLRQPF